MTEYYGLIVAVLVVIVVLELQRRSFISTRKLIRELKSLFPDVSSLSIIETLISKDDLKDDSRLKSNINSPLSKKDIVDCIKEDDSVDNIQEYINDNYVEVSLVFSKQNSSKRFADIVIKTNMYLAKNIGTSADFGQIKEICEGQLESLENNIHNSLNVPLYLGLAGTFIGIITGLVGIDFNAIFSTDQNNLIGLQYLLYGVVCAMSASLIGLTLAVYNTSVSYKKASINIDSSKEEYYDFLRREIMPVLSNNMSSSLNSLKGVLGHFVDKFGRNLDTYADSADLLNDNLEKQHLVLQQLNQLSLTKTANKIAETFLCLKDSSDSLSVFKSYQDSLNKTIVNMGNTTQKIDSLFGQFDSMRKGLEIIVANQSSTLELHRQFKLSIEDNFPSGGEAREAWRKEFDSLIEDAQKASYGLSEQLTLSTQYISNFVGQNKDFFESFDKLKDVIAAMVQYTDVQAKCYNDLKQEIVQMRIDYKDAQRDSVATNLAILEAVKEMTNAVKVIKNSNHGN